MFKVIIKQTDLWAISLVYYPSELYYSGAYITLSKQVMKLPIKSVASQRI